MVVGWWLMTGVASGSGRDNQDHECDKNHCHRRRRGGSGEICHRPAGWGTDHAAKRGQPGTGACKLHGGSTTTHRVAAQARQARAAAATYGLPVEIHPAQALLEEVQRTAGAVAFVGAIIASMDQKDLVWGIAEQTVTAGGDEAGGGTQTKYKAGKSVWLQIYQDERKHLAAVARDALGADAAGRVAAVFEQIGTAYVQMFERVLDRVELTPSQRAAIPGVLMEELQALPDGGR